MMIWSEILVAIGKLIVDNSQVQKHFLPYVQSVRKEKEEMASERRNTHEMGK